MGVYYRAGLFLGIVGSAKEDINVDFSNLKDDLEEHFEDRKKVITVEVFDSSYKNVDGAPDDEDANVIVGFEIGYSGEATNNWGLNIKDRLDEADKFITKDLILELEENFPTLDWGPIEIRNVITAG